MRRSQVVAAAAGEQAVARRRYRRLLGFLILLQLASPAAAGPVEPCSSGEGALVLGRGACVVVEYTDPLDELPDPLLPTLTACNIPGMNGVNVSYWGGGYAAACANAGATVPNGSCRPVRGCVGVLITECGPGIDPTILLFGGSVYFCAAVIYELEMVGVPPVVVDLTPCPGGFDPKVSVGNVSVTVCVVVFA